MSLVEWDIRNVFTVTVDSACSDDSVVEYLSEKVTPIFKAELMKITDCPYIIDVVGEECFKYNHLPISRVRDVVRHVRAIPARLKKFKACVKQEKISSENFPYIDVSAEWSSTYLMLETAEKFEKAFQCLEDEDEEYFHEFCLLGERRAPTHVDWEIARACVKFLEPFYSESLEIPKNLQVTSNSFFCELSWIYNQLQSRSDSKDLHLKKTADFVRKKCSKYWEDMDSINPLLFVAGLLDPRCKEKVLKCHLAPICGDLLADEITKKARKALNDLYELYSTLYPRSEKPKIGISKIEMSYWRYCKQRDEEMGLKTEVDKYLKSDCETEYDEFDVLDWWKAHTGSYRILARIARDVSYSLFYRSP